MKIESSNIRVGFDGKPSSTGKLSKEEKESSVAKKDTIQISKDAMMLASEGIDGTINRVKANIASGFYNSPEVMSKVADKLLNELV